MDSLQQILERVSEKVQQLGSRLREEQRQKEEFERENRLLKEQLLIFQQQTNKETAQMRGVLRQWHQENPQLAEEFKLEIERNISRIDKCIEWLEKN